MKSKKKKVIDQTTTVINEAQKSKKITKPPIYIVDDEWYKDRKAVLKYFSWASGVAISFLILMNEKVLPQLAKDYKKLFALALLMLSLSALSGFIGYVTAFRLQHFYSHEKEITEFYKDQRFRNFIFKFVPLYKWIERFGFYASYFLGILSFIAGVIIIMYMIIHVYWN